MTPELRAAFPAMTEQWEGRVPHMYLDKLGLVTCGVGNLIDDRTGDPPNRVFGLSWRFAAGGQLAGHDAVAAEWRKIKAAVDLARLGATAAGRMATLRLANADINALVARQMENNHAALLYRWPGIDTMPLKVQLVLHSMAWACGAGFHREFGQFAAAVDRHDWPAALAHCHMRDADNPGLRPRNAENERLLREVIAESSAPAPRHAVTGATSAAPVPVAVPLPPPQTRWPWLNALLGLIVRGGR